MFEFGVLGALSVRRDGVDIAISSAMVRRILSILLCRGYAPISVADLAAAVWHGEPPPSARKTIHGYIHRLRRALGDDSRVKCNAMGYSIAVAPEEVDATRFLQLISEARRARRQHDLVGAKALLDRALGLWRGPAYAGAADVDVVAEEADRLLEQHVLAQEEGIAVALDLGADVELLAELRALTRVQPYRERLLALSMVALYRSGLRADSLAAFRSARQLLNEELGIEPSALLQRLHRAILRDDERLHHIATTQILSSYRPSELGSIVADVARLGAVPAPDAESQILALQSWAE